MAGIFKKGKRAFVAYAAITFVVLLIITQLLVYQRYSINRAAERTDLEHELDEVRGRLGAILLHNISTANTVAMLYQHDRTFNWFDSTSPKLLALNEGLDMIQVYEVNVATHVYPLKGNEKVIGQDLMKIPRFKAEAELSDKTGQLAFAGPYDRLLTKDKAIAGRVRAYDHGRLAARIAVVSSFSSIFKLIPEFQNKGDKFVFRLGKKSPLTGQVEYFFDGYTPKAGWVDSVYMPVGAWTLYAAYHKGYESGNNVYLLSLFGILFSALGALFVYNRTHETLRLEHAIVKKTHDLDERMKELSTIYQANEILKDELQSVSIALSRVVNILPAGWQYPDVCAARIVIGDDVYATKNYEDTPHKLQALLSFADGRAGNVEVVYLKKMPREDEGPFLKEERELINSIAETIELFYNKKYHRERITRSEGILRSLIEATPVAIVLCDKDFNLMAVNSVMATRYIQMMGKSLEVGDNFIEALVPRDREEVYNVFTKVMEEHEPIEYEQNYVLPLGNLNINITVAPVMSGDTAIGVAVAMHDIANRKRREEEHHRMLESLTQHKAAMGEYMRLLTQKLREPLQAIEDQVSQATAEANEQKRKEIIEKLQQLVQRADKVVVSLDEVLTGKKS